MFIIDAQVHMYGPNTPERPWVITGHVPEMLPSVTASELSAAMAEAGVNRAVLVPPGRDADRNDLCLAAAQAHPDRFAVMGRVPIDRPDSPKLLEELFAEPGMLGFRLTIMRSMKHVFESGTIDAFWKAAERLRVPLMIYAPTLSKEVGDLARAYPGLPIILDHINLSEAMKGTDKIGEAVNQVLDLAPLENVSVKVSALPCYSSEAYPYRDMQSHARRVIERFGVERCFWGTDYSRLPCSYRQAITMFTEEMPFLSGDDLEWVMGRGLAEKLRWKIKA
jgi:predicted TIM-barrel fold metal-dependent hydrolase